MNQPYENRQRDKTKKLLYEALVSLILEKDYDTIIVQDILNRANVGRSTFYVHYKDKDHLLMAWFSDLRKNLEDALRAAAPIHDDLSENLLRFSLFMFEHAHERMELYRALAPKRGAFILQALQVTLTGFIGEQAKPLFEKKEGLIPSALFVHFLASSFVSVMSWWVEQKKPISPKRINVIFRAIVMPSITAYIN